jgi:predicted RNA-binding Zn ribbon-like protein
MYDQGVIMSNQEQEPGERLGAPTEGLRRLQAFVNTNDIDEERDEIGTPAKMRDWLASEGAIGAGDAVSADAHRRAIAVREGLRALGRGHNGEPLNAEELAALAALNAASADLPLLASVVEPETWRLRAATGGVEGFLAETIATLIGAMADGTWSRIKACRNDTCRWLFYDYSRNRSGTWCSMAVCGSRLKARAYRARRRQALAANA